jgi:hypothetical protein
MHLLVKENATLFSESSTISAAIAYKRRLVLENTITMRTTREDTRGSTMYRAAIHKLHVRKPVLLYIF